MARKWQNQDSARTMTAKYNETAEEVAQLKKVSEKSSIDSEKVKEDIDNLNKAIEPMITSEPVGNIESQDTGYIKTISIKGTKLVISV